MILPRASIHRPGAVPRGFFSTVAPSITLRLAFVDFGHGAAESAESLVDRLQHFVVGVEFAA